MTSLLQQANVTACTRRATTRETIAIPSLPPFFLLSRKSIGFIFLLGAHGNRVLPDGSGRLRANAKLTPLISTIGARAYTHTHTHVIRIRIRVHAPLILIVFARIEENQKDSTIYGETSCETSVRDAYVFPMNLQQCKLNFKAPKYSSRLHRLVRGNN